MKKKTLDYRKVSDGANKQARLTVTLMLASLRFGFVRPT